MSSSRSFFDHLFAEVRPVEEIRRSLRMASRKHEMTVKNLKGRIEDLEDWLGELALLNQTMLRLLLAKKAFTREEFGAVLREIDLLDGVEDGKATPAKEPKPAPEKKAPPAGGRKG